MALLRVSVNIVIGAVIIVYGINDLNLTGASLMVFETLVYFIQGCIFIYIIIGVFENSKIFK